MEWEETEGETGGEKGAEEKRVSAKVVQKNCGIKLSIEQEEQKLQGSETFIY